MKDRERFLKNFAALAELWGERLSKPKIELFWRALERYEDDDVAAGILEAARSCKYGFPKPADIIDFIEGSSDTKAALAWGQVLKAISDNGFYRSVRFYDPAIHTVLEALGGWMEISGKTTTELKYLEAQFRRLFVYYHKRDNHSDHLIGYFEATNRSKGHLSAVPDVVNIALPDRPLKARAITDGLRQIEGPKETTRGRDKI